ncbi:MAG: hypothetical protein OXJ52_09580 [Oligoflexia bacterium]|nr:hypothetical protein [Oligoflexia bacterium]
MLSGFVQQGWDKSVSIFLLFKAYLKCLLMDSRSRPVFTRAGFREDKFAGRTACLEITGKSMQIG